MTVESRLFASASGLGRTSSDMFIALVGTPNSGKTTVYNMLTREKRRVANYSGVTADVAVGRSYFDDSLWFVDVPGRKSLSGYKNSEQLAEAVVVGAAEACPTVDVYLIIFSAVHLRAGLHLLHDLLQYDRPVIVGLTGVEEARKKGFLVHSDRIESIAKVPCVEIRLNSDETSIRVCEIIKRYRFRIYREGVRSIFDEQDNLEQRPSVPDSEATQPLSLPSFLPQSMALGEGSVSPASDKELWVENLVEQCVEGLNRSSVRRISALQVLEPDQLLGNYGWATLFLLGWFLCFQLMYLVCSSPSRWIDTFVVKLRGEVAGTLGFGFISEFVCDVVVTGVGAFLVWLPALLFLQILVSGIEQSGLIPRLSLGLDSLCRLFGFSGRVIPALVSALRCERSAASMASQLGDPKERALTLLLIPFVHLSSRLPLSYLLIQAVVPGYKLGMFTLRGVVLALTSIVPVLAVCGCYRLSFSLLAHKVKIPDLDTEVAVRTPRWSLVLPDALPRFGSQLVSWVVYSLLASSLVWVLSSRLTPADERSHTHFDNAQLGENAISYLWAFGLDKTTSLAVVSSLISRAAIPSALATSRSIRQRQHEANRRAMVLSEKSWVLGDRAHTNPRATLWSLLALSLFAPFSVVGIVRLSKAHSSVWLPGVYILLSSSLGLLSAFIIRNVCFS